MSSPLTYDKPGGIGREDAARLLITEGALIELSHADAQVVVQYMVARRVKSGFVLFHEAEAHHTDFMVLLLEGEVTVEHTCTPNQQDGLVITVLRPGALFGEMGVLDGAPRSATCTASTELAVAILTRDSLMKLTIEKPAVAARVLLAISKRMSENLRETNRKLIALARVNRAIQEELDATHSVNQRLLADGSKRQSRPAPIVGVGVGAGEASRTATGFEVTQRLPR